MKAVHGDGPTFFMKVLGLDIPSLFKVVTFHIENIVVLIVQSKSKDRFLNTFVVGT